jgi:pyruvate kinase
LNRFVLIFCEENILNGGASYIRMNFSHATYEFHLKTYEMIRKVSLDVNNHVAVVIDLQGPKLRCNNFPNGSIIIEQGDSVLIVASKEDGKQGVNGEMSVITTPFEPMINHCNVGQPVLFDDGLIRMVIKEKSENYLVASVIQGGFLFVVVLEFFFRHS